MCIEGRSLFCCGLGSQSSSDEKRLHAEPRLTAFVRTGDEDRGLLWLWCGFVGECDEVPLSTCATSSRKSKPFTKSDAMSVNLDRDPLLFIFMVMAGDSTVDKLGNARARRRCVKVK